MNDKRHHLLIRSPEALPHPEVAKQLPLLEQKEATALVLPSLQLCQLCCVVCKAQSHALCA